jgi:putative ATP-dependent endonuclease of the OLD family
LWDRELNESIKSSDKPYNSWKRVRDYLDNKIKLTPKCESTLKEIITFAFCS